MEGSRKIRLPKMRVELPEFKRCCYCIPLRYGLLVWGYIKLVTTVVLFLIGALVVQMYMQLLLMLGYVVLPVVLIGIAFLLFLMVDIAMTVVFLIGGHRKTQKLLKVFYIYSIVSLCVDIAVFFISTVYDLSVGDNYNHQSHNSRHSTSDASFVVTIVTKVVISVVFIGVQAYLVLLVRSEINKLRNNRNFRFTNIATEAECSMENGNNEHGNGTHISNNGTEDREIGIHDQLQGNFRQVQGPATKEGTFDYNQF